MNECTASTETINVLVGLDDETDILDDGDHECRIVVVAAWNDAPPIVGFKALTLGCNASKQFPEWALAA